MSGTGGLARRRQERPRRSTFIDVARVSNTRVFRRKQRKGWAAYGR